MDQINGQLLLALSCVAVAAAVLVRRVVRLVRDPAGSGCGSGGCGSCPSKDRRTGDVGKELIELQFENRRD